MEQSIDFKLHKTISDVFDATKESKLSDDLFEKINPDLDELANYFNVSRSQAFILAHVFVLNCQGDYVDSNDLGKHFACNLMKFISYYNEMDSLVEKGILNKKRSSHRLIEIANNQYVMNEQVSSAIIKNLPMPELKPLVYNDIIEILHTVYSIGQERDERLINTSDLLDQTKKIIDSNIRFKFLKKVKQLELEPINAYFFLYLCWKTITGNEKTDLVRAVNGIFDDTVKRITWVQRFLAKNNELIKKDLVEIIESTFLNDTEVKITEKAISMLSSEKIKLFSSKKKNENLITPDKIGEKLLFFSKSEKSQLEMIEKTLDDKKLIKLQRKLKSKTMPQGITVLLYGAPGTGKTESVYQIAKKTGREIMRVEISQSKSMWFGESEKVIKRIFTDYNELVEQSDKCPILFFNEADAIFSKRKDSSSSNVSQTENAIQNIILEELENFKGILFATTNLTENFDSAFERRFLFKVEFCIPDFKIRTEIWKSKLYYYTREECETLAKMYDFSGGQIDNVVRKITMYEVLNNNIPHFNLLIQFCKEESISKGNFNSIGFKKISA